MSMSMKIGNSLAASYDKMMNWARQQAREHLSMGNCQWCAGLNSLFLVVAFFIVSLILWSEPPVSIYQDRDRFVILQQVVPIINRQGPSSSPPSHPLPLIHLAFAYHMIRLTLKSRCHGQVLVVTLSVCAVFSSPTWSFWSPLGANKRLCRYKEKKLRI